MTTSQAGIAAAAQGQGKPTASIGQILRLLSAGVPGAILLALSEGPTQTKVLTHRVRGYTARTVYRYLARLSELGLIERDDEPGGHARVVHTLREGCGSELCALIDRFAAASMTRLPDGQVEPNSWTSLGLLADLWEAGVVDELSRGPQSPTELARGLDALSYHQLNRRASRFKDAGFLGELPGAQRQRRCYALTDMARRSMGLIAGLGRWRQRHLVADGKAGLDADEMATVLRASLPLARVPQHAGSHLTIAVVAGDEGPREIGIEIADDGAVRVDGASASRQRSRVEGDVDSWMEALLDGILRPNEDDNRIAEDCVAGLYRELWAPKTP